MAEIRLPLSVTYDTEGATPVADLIEALQATNALVGDTVALLPTFVPGIRIEESSLNVRVLSQESPLREAFFIALLVTYQEDLQREVPHMIEDLFGITVSDKYDSIASVVFLTVLFYGAALAIDAVKRAVTPSLPRERFQDVAKVLSAQTGRSTESIEDVLRVHFEKPSASQRLLTSAKRFFRPSQKDRNAPVQVDRERLDRELVREVPYPGATEKKSDFDRYTPYSAATIELHAKDKDKAATGWAATVPGVVDVRTKLRVMPPIEPSDLWGKDALSADIVVVSKLTANGYVPAEVQIVRIVSSGELP